MRSPIEARLTQIAWLALASGACKPAETGAPPAPVSPVVVEVPAASAPDASTNLAIASDLDAAASAPLVPADPQKVCAQYRASTANDPDGAHAKDPSAVMRAFAPLMTAETFGRRLDAGTIECRLVWERRETSETITVTPQCCPQGRRGNAPCPPASPATFPGHRDKVEVAVVTNDAAPVSSTVTWQMFVQEPPRHMCGRRPEGFQSESCATQARSIGDCLAEMAELEAASIAAFDRLARELVALGAPTILVDRAKAARRDEVRHARAMRVLARRHGGRVRTASPATNLPVRERLAVAIENAVEGCVNETLGAVIATFQAERAEDPDLRAAFASIAEDERRHAALAWNIDAWLAAELTEREREAVDHARCAARNQLRFIAQTEDEETQRVLGLPSTYERRVMASGVSELAG